MKSFDRRFGKEVFDSLPTTPGIYRFFNEAGEVIYVGKAKNLRRRLGQYRNAKRRKAHHKMIKIMIEARRLEHEVCVSELEALRLENSIIQTLRPKWNVAGAFYFLYPMIGVQMAADEIHFCYTTTPSEYPEFTFHGAFRSRRRTKEGFFALIELLRLIGHPMKLKRKKVKLALSPRSKRPVKNYTYGFRKIPEEWIPRIGGFLRGECFSAIEELSLLLLESPTALSRSKETQEQLYAIRRFWRHEVLVLKQACERAKFAEYPVPQRERDLVFINGKKSPKLAKPELSRDRPFPTHI